MKRRRRGARGGDNAVFQMKGEPAHGGLDLGKFGHLVSLSGGRPDVD